MTTLSPEAFMAQPPEPDEELAPAATDPLASIADSLRRLVEHVDQGVADERTSDRLTEELADLEEKYNALYEVLEEIEAVVKPSTSKLANTVRSVINLWRGPAVPEPVTESKSLVEHPSHDAPVEEWRGYAASVGYPEGTVIDQMNRSQIRSMLGIEQPGTPVAPSVVHA